MFRRSLGWWYFTYGFLFGCGSSFAFQPSLVILGHYFRRRLGLANGLVTAGSSLFSIGMPALLEEVGVPLGLSATFQILSAFMLIQATLSLSFIPRLIDKEPSKESAPDPCVRADVALTKRLCNLGVFHLPTYRLWVFGVATAVLGYFVPYVHLMSFVKEQFVETPVKEWVLLVCIGVSSGVGRLLFGRVGDLLKGARKIFLQAASFMLLGLASILIPLCLQFEGLVAACLLLGLCDGCFITLMAPVAFELVGPQRASQAIGYLLGLMALPMTAGPPLAGLLHDHLGDYHMAFYLAGIPPLAGGALLLFVPYVHQRMQKVQNETSTTPSPQHPPPSNPQHTSTPSPKPQPYFSHEHPCPSNHEHSATPSPEYQPKTMSSVDQFSVHCVETHL